MGPTWIKKNKNKNQTYVWHPIDKGREREVMFFFFSFYYIYFILRFQSFGPSEFVGINTESALRDEGYA